MFDGADRDKDNSLADNEHAAHAPDQLSEDSDSDQQHKDTQYATTHSPTLHRDTSNRARSESTERNQQHSLQEKDHKQMIQKTGESKLERVLTRLTDGLHNTENSQTESSPSTSSKPQRPLQIHLDVAAIERGTDSFIGSQSQDGDKQPGLLSHYLQLADVGQQQVDLSRRQRRNAAGYREPPAYEGARQSAVTFSSNEGRQRSNRISKVRDYFTQPRLRRRKQNTSRYQNQFRDTTRRDSRGMLEPDSNNTVDLSNTTPSTARASLDTFPDEHTPNQSRFMDTTDTDEIRREQGGGNETSSSNIDNNNPDPFTASNPSPNNHVGSRPNNSIFNLVGTFASTDLTRFLPYALSAPGIHSMTGTPLHPPMAGGGMSNIDDWFSHRSHMREAFTTTESQTPYAQSTASGDDMRSPNEEAMLDEKRALLVDGIKRLMLHQRFICLLAQAMMEYGAPLHHLEDNLSRMSRHLCIAATFTTLPGLVLISIEDTSTFTAETRIIRCPNGFDMHRLEMTDRVFRSVSKDEIDVEEGTKRLKEIRDAPPLFSWYWQLFVWGMSSWSVCLLAFSGSWIDSLAAFILGLVAGSLNLLAGRLKGFTNLFEVTISIICGFIASVFERWVCFAAVTLSATVVLLPGLLLTTGVIELASRNMHAGTIRVAYALMIAIVIAFGVNLGNDIFVEIFSRPDRRANMDMAACSPVSQWWWWLAFPIAITAICLLINVHPRNWHACIVVAGTMFVVFWALVIHLNLRTIGPVVSAFVLGLAANIWSKVFKHNAYAIMLPGMMILVPGSVGVRGIMSMFSGTVGGASSRLAAQMAQTSLSIVVGLFASSFVVYPRGKKQSALLTV